MLEDIPTQLVQIDCDGQTHDDLYGSFCQQMSDATHWIGVLSADSGQDDWTAWLLGAATMACRRTSFAKGRVNCQKV